MNHILPFKKETNPPPVQTDTARTVRFDEIDAMGVVWHGKYASYFDDARKKMGDTYGFSYSNFMQKKIKVPVKHFFADYITPLKFDDRILIRATLYWCDAARLNMTYEIFNDQNILCASGYTVQLFMDENNKLLLSVPECVSVFREKWAKGLYHA